MYEMTARALRDAFAANASAALQYGAWATRAEAENRTDISRLFRAARESRERQGGALLAAIEDQSGGGDRCGAQAGGVFAPADTARNLLRAVEMEAFDLIEAYPAYLRVAQLQSRRRAVTVFERAIDCIKMRASLFGKAKDAADVSADAEFGPFKVCPACGFLFDGEHPIEACPLCQASAESFLRFE